MADDYEYSSGFATNRARTGLSRSRAPRSSTRNDGALARVYDSQRMLGNRTSEQWIAQYATSHQHPVNRFCHTFGIPLILVSVAVFITSFFVHRLWLYGLSLFVIGWIFQFVGHAFEGKPPEFFQDWRFLFVGVRWWWAKIRGRA